MVSSRSMRWPPTQIDCKRDVVRFVACWRDLARKRRRDNAPPRGNRLSIRADYGSASSSTRRGRMSLRGSCPKRRHSPAPFFTPPERHIAQPVTTLVCSRIPSSSSTMATLYGAPGEEGGMLRAVDDDERIDRPAAGQRRPLVVRDGALRREARSVVPSPPASRLAGFCATPLCAVRLSTRIGSPLSRHPMGVGVPAMARAYFGSRPVTRAAGLGHLHGRPRLARAALAFRPGGRLLKPLTGAPCQR
jgi:hypothetical protein